MCTSASKCSIPQVQYPKSTIMLLELTENCFRMRFLLILFIDMVKKKKQQIKKENRLILCQSRNLVTGVAICCDKISWPWVIALKATNEWLALLWHAEWPPGSSCKDLMTGVKLTRGIMLFSKHDSSQISIQLAQWGLKEELRHLVNDFSGVPCEP